MNKIESVRYYIEESLTPKVFTLALEKDGKKQYVLSKYRPIEHALSMLGEDFGNKQTIWIIFGFGFGYMLKEIIRRVGEQVRVIIIEPNSELLQKQIEMFKERELISKDNVSIFSGNSFEQIWEKLRLAITNIDFNNVKIKSIKGYLEYYGEYYRKVLSLIEECIIAKEINFNTIIYMKETCTKNIIRNRYAIAEGYDLSKHEKKYVNTPALIVSAGPSLKKNIELIKDFKGIIFVMGRTLTPVLEQGVTPDFVVSVDMSDVIHETFKKHKEYDIPLITMCESNWKVVNGSRGPKYFIHNSPTLKGLLGVGANPVLDLAGSVATLCLSSAEYMGCNPIIFIGQDLAYTNNEKHSELTISNKDKVIGNKIDQESKILRTIKSYDGKSVLSKDSLISFLRWIEDFIRDHSHTTYINSTEGGAYIEGAIHIPFKQAIVEYCQDNKPNIFHEKLIEDKKLNIDDNLNDSIERLKEICVEVGKVKDCYEKLLQEYTSSKLEQKHQIRKLIKEIEEADKRLVEINGPRNIINIMMERISLVLRSSNNSKEPIEETEDESKIRKLRLNYETYEALEMESKKLIELIEKELE